MSYSAPNMANLTLASINVNGLRAQFVNGLPKRRKIFTWIKKLNFDVIFLQETHSSISDSDSWLNEWGGLGVFAHGDNKSRGVGVLLRPNSGLGIDKIFADKDGRFLTLELEYNGSTVTIGNFYGPNIDNTRAIEDFLYKVTEYENATVILGGDFNLCLNVSKDRESSARRVSNNDKCKQTLERFMLEHDLIDLWRELHPHKRFYTCVRSNPPSKSRIDFFLTSRNVLFTNNSPTAAIRDGYLSDHKMVTISVNIPATELGRSFWKFNNHLLKDETFLDMVRRKIPEIMDDNQSSTASNIALLETLLCVLRGHIIQFASHKKRKAREEFDKIEQDIAKLENSVDSDPRDIETLLERRDGLIQETTSKAMFQSRARWRNLAETGTKYFHGLQKRNRCRNVCKALFVSDKDKQSPKVITNVTDEMLEEGREFFADLYRQRPAMGVSDSFRVELPRLSEEDAEICERPIDLQELSLAVFSTRNNTSPGPSGYTGEFFKILWPELKHLVHRAVCEILNAGRCL